MPRKSSDYEWDWRLPSQDDDDDDGWYEWEEQETNDAG